MTMPKHYHHSSGSGRHGDSRRKSRSGHARKSPRYSGPDSRSSSKSESGHRRRSRSHQGQRSTSHRRHYRRHRSQLSSGSSRSSSRSRSSNGNSHSHRYGTKSGQHTRKHRRASRSTRRRPSSSRSSYSSSSGSRSWSRSIRAGSRCSKSTSRSMSRRTTDELEKRVQDLALQLAQSEVCHNEEMRQLEEKVNLLQQEKDREHDQNRLQLAESKAFQEEVHHLDEVVKSLQQECQRAWAETQIYQAQQHRHSSQAQDLQRSEGRNAGVPDNICGSPEDNLHCVVDSHASSSAPMVKDIHSVMVAHMMEEPQGQGDEPNEEVTINIQRSDRSQLSWRTDATPPSSDNWWRRPHWRRMSICFHCGQWGHNWRNCRQRWFNTSSSGISPHRRKLLQTRCDTVLSQVTHLRYFVFLVQCIYLSYSYFVMFILTDPSVILFESSPVPMLSVGMGSNGVDWSLRGWDGLIYLRSQENTPCVHIMKKMTVTLLFYFLLYFLGTACGVDGMA